MRLDLKLTVLGIDQELARELGLKTEVLIFFEKEQSIFPGNEYL